MSVAVDRGRATVSQFYEQFAEDFGKIGTSKKDIMDAYDRGGDANKKTMLAEARKNLADVDPVEGRLLARKMGERGGRRKFADADTSHQDAQMGALQEQLATSGPAPDAMAEDDREWIGSYLAKVYDLWKNARSGMDRQTAINSALELLDSSDDSAAA